MWNIRLHPCLINCKLLTYNTDRQTNKLTNINVNFSKVKTPWALLTESGNGTRLGGTRGERAPQHGQSPNLQVCYVDRCPCYLGHPSGCLSLEDVFGIYIFLDVLPFYINMKSTYFIFFLVILAIFVSILYPISGYPCYLQSFKNKFYLSKCSGKFIT